MDKAKVTELLSNDGSDVTGSTIETPPWRESGRGMVVAVLTGTDNFSSAVAVQGSHDGSAWEAIGTVTCDQADTVKSLAIDYPWPFMRAVPGSGSGTRSKLRVTLAQ